MGQVISHKNNHILCRHFSWFPPESRHKLLHKRVYSLGLDSLELDSLEQANCYHVSEQQLRMNKLRHPIQNDTTLAIGTFMEVTQNIGTFMKVTQNSAWAQTQPFDVSNRILSWPLNCFTTNTQLYCYTYIVTMYVPDYMQLYSLLTIEIFSLVTHTWTQLLCVTRDLRKSEGIFHSQTFH